MTDPTLAQVIDLDEYRRRRNPTDRPPAAAALDTHAGSDNVVAMPEHVTRERRQQLAAEEFQRAMAELAEGIARLRALRGVA